jgi:hypothetical protein
VSTLGDTGPSLIGYLLAAAASLGGAWLLYRGSRRTAEDTRRTAADANEIEQARLNIASWSEQVMSWRSDVVELRKQRAEDLVSYEEAHKALIAKVDDLASKHRMERAETEQRINAMVLWGQQVVGIMRARGITFPPPPPGMQPWLDSHESAPLTDPGLPNPTP